MIFIYFPWWFQVYLLGVALTWSWEILSSDYPNLTCGKTALAKSLLWPLTPLFFLVNLIRGQL